MICDVCNGRGMVMNPRFYSSPSWKSYEMGYDIPIRCCKCGGTGFLIGNAKDAISVLNSSIKRNKPLSMLEIKQLKLLLQK